VTSVTWLVVVPTSECLQFSNWLWTRGIPGIGSCLCGGFGGVISHILAARRRAKEGIGNNVGPPPSGWQHEVPGDIVIGIAVGLVTYLLGMNDVPIGKILGVAVLGGVSGGKYFNRDQEVREAQKESKSARAKAKVFKNSTDTSLEPVVKEKTNGGE
jgi:hypothetical protein